MLNLTPPRLKFLKNNIFNPNIFFKSTKSIFQNLKIFLKSSQTFHFSSKIRFGIKLFVKNKESKSSMELKCGEVWNGLCKEIDCDVICREILMRRLVFHPNLEVGTPCKPSKCDSSLELHMEIGSFNALA